MSQQEMDLRGQVAMAIARYDWNHGLSANGTPGEHAMGEAEAVLEVVVPLIEQHRQDVAVLAAERDESTAELVRAATAYRNERDAAEASRRDWAAEADRMASELGKYADVVFRRQSSPVWADLVSKLRRIASGARGGCGFVSDDGNVCELDDEHSGPHLRWFDEIRYEVLTRTPDVCSCLTAEGAAQVAADPRWSLPLCAVHPEADR